MCIRCIHYVCRYVVCVACVTWFIFVVDTYVAGVVELSVFHFSCTIILALQQMDVGKFQCNNFLVRI